MKYTYKNPERIKNLTNSPRGPKHLIEKDNYVRFWGHYRTGPVLCHLIEKYNLKSFVEVGCCGAQNCEVILLEFPDVKVVAVDITFTGATTRIGQRIQPPINEMKKEFGERFVAIEQPSVSAATNFTDESLDIVYIDDDHSYKGCKNSIEAWWPKVKIGGILAGHDYGHNQNPGVKKVVDETFTNKKLNRGDYFNWWVHK